MHGRAAGRRRVRDPAAGRMGRGRATRCCRVAARARGADDARWPCRRRARERRHRRMPRARARKLDADAPGGHRDVRGQAQQPGHHRLGRTIQPARPRAAVADERFAQGGRRQRTGARVSAEGVAGRRSTPMRRGAGALASSDARRRAADRLHSFRGTDRLHPGDHAVGADAGAYRSAPRGAPRACRSTCRSTCPRAT